MRTYKMIAETFGTMEVFEVHPEIRLSISSGACNRLMGVPHSSGIYDELL